MSGQFTCQIAPHGDSRSGVIVKDFGISRDVPVRKAKTALLFVDVQYLHRR